MVILRFLLLVALIFTSPSLWAFNGLKCSSLFPTFDSQKPHPPYFSVFYTTTMIPSTTSYFSSLGKCAMYGDKGFKAFRIFYARNSYEPLQLGLSRGEGDYVRALAYLSGCPDSMHAHFSKVMKSHFEEIFSTDPKSSDAMLKNVDQYIHSDKQLNKSCRFQGA